MKRRPVRQRRKCPAPFRVFFPARFITYLGTSSFVPNRRAWTSSIAFHQVEIATCDRALRRRSRSAAALDDTLSREFAHARPETARTERREAERAHARIPALRHGRSSYSGPCVRVLCIARLAHRGSR